MKNKITLLVGAAFMTLTGFSQTINTFPYNEDFEAEATCGTGAGSACVLSGDFFNVTTGDDVDWTVDVNGTGSSNTGPTANGGADHNPGIAGGQYVYVETSSPVATGDIAILESPWFNFTATPSIALNFWYHAFGTSQGDLYVAARITQSGTWDTIAGPITDNLDMWQELEISLGAVYGGLDSVQVRFEYARGTSFGGDFALDDISMLVPIQVDLGVTALDLAAQCSYGVTESIDITVCNIGDTTYGVGTMIPVSYAVNGGIPVTENIMLTAALATDSCVNYTFTTLADLSAAGAFDVSAWTSYVGDAVTNNDTTIAGFFNSIGNGIPYFENFESGQAGWSINDLSGNSTWDYGTPANTIINSAASGDSAYVTNLTGTYNGGEDGNVTSPCIDISGATGAEVVSIKIWWESEQSWDGANLFSSVDAGATWQQVGANGDPNNWYNDNTINGSPNGSGEGWTGRNGGGSGAWVCAENALDSAMLVNNTALLLRVGFGSDGSVNDEGFAFDDVAIGINNLTYDFGTDSILGICDTEHLLDAGAGYDFYHWSGAGENVNTQMLTATTTGTYVITVSDSTGMCAKDTVYLEILNFERPNLIDVVTCAGDTAGFDANGGTNSVYSWSTGSTSQMETLVLPGMINVTKTDTVTGCTETDTAMFTYNVPVALGADISVCTGDIVNLDATTASASYLWNTGDTVAMISTTASGTFTVTVMDTLLGCPASSDTINVVVNALPVLDLGPDITNCDIALIDAADSTFASYNWSTSDTTASISVLTPGTYSLTITDLNGCVDSDSINVTINTATLDLGADTSNCDAFLIDASGSLASSYLWNTLDTTASISVTATGTYVLAIFDANGCAAVDSIDVTINTATPVNLGADTTVCDTIGYALDAGSATSYLWNDASTNQTLTPTTSGTYSVTTTDANGCESTDSVVVTVTVCVGIGELSNGVSVNLYPNPTKGNLTLSLSKLTDKGVVTITNIYGQVVRTEQVNSTITNLDLTNLANGTYSFKLQVNDSILIDKFIINR